MGLFRKNRDPLDNRAKSVRNQLADLQSQIEKLGDPNQPFASQPAPVVHDLKPDDQPLPRRPVLPQTRPTPPQPSQRGRHQTQTALVRPPCRWRR